MRPGEIRPMERPERTGPERRRETRATTKRPYSPPALVAYGDVETITRHLRVGGRGVGPSTDDIF